MKNPKRRYSFIRIKKRWLADLGSYYPYHVHQKKAEILSLLGQWTQAQDIYRSNMEVAEKYGAGSEVAESKNELGWTYYSLGDTETGLKYYREAYSVYQSVNNLQGQASVLGRIGNYHYYHGNHQQALDCFSQALNLTREQTDQITRANIFNNMANIYGEQNQPGLSREYYQKGLEVFRQAGDLQKQAGVLGNLGVVSWMEGDYPRAEELFLQQLNISREVGDKFFYSGALGNLAALHLIQGDYTMSLKYLQERLPLVRELGDKRGLASTFNFLGNLHKAQNQMELARQYFAMAVELGREQDIKFYLPEYLYDLAESEYQTDRIEESRRLAVEAEQNARLINDTDVLHKCQKLLIKLDWAGDFGQQSLRLEAMLNQPLNEQQRAELFYDLYKIKNSQDCRQKALELYQMLYQKTPILDYREKIEELGLGAD